MLDKIETFSDFDNHEMISAISDESSGLKGFIAIHRRNSSNPSFGATRLWHYASLNDALEDVLRLSKLMSYKAAMAGLPCGGAKAVIVGNGLPKVKKNELLKAYARKVNYFCGSFVTGADVGISREDVVTMRRYSSNFVGTKTEPVRYTALGLLYSIEEVLYELYGSRELEGRTFSIQGVGKVGERILSLVYPYAQKVYIADKDKKKLMNVRKDYPKVTAVDTSKIHGLPVDIFSPNALSHCLNHKSVSELRCKGIVGGANNQLESDLISVLLYKMGILYAPDYVVNAGGLISVYDEYENGNYRVKRITKKTEKIRESLRMIIKESKKRKVDTNTVSNKIAEKIIGDYLR